MIKRTVSFLMSLLLLLTCSACMSTGKKAEDNQLAEPGTKAAETLDGKKVIFVGCSYTYYGYAVHQGEMYQDSQNKVFSQEERSNDQAYFYQLCKANGVEVSVTDWTYGGHDLSDLFDGKCNADRGHDGHDHTKDLVDRAYDYVILQEIQPPGMWSAERYLQNVEEIMEVFRAANPDVKFYYAIHDGVYTQEYYPRWKKSIKLIEDAGVTIIDWGTLVWDVWNGTETVPGAELAYNKNSFIVSRTSGDGYHPNPLSGYLNSLMTYCAITGETAVGQPYSFCTSDQKSLDLYKRSYYKWDDKKTVEDETATNFVEILSSEADMKGLQNLVDKYLEEDTKMSSEYKIIFQAEDGTVLQEKTCQYGDVVTGRIPTKPGDTSESYEFVGWDKEIVRCAGDATYTAVFKKK